MVKKIVVWTMVFLTITSIFFFSTELGVHSQERSSKLTQLILTEATGLVSNDFTGSPVAFDRIHYFIRKSGHIFEYMLLAFFLAMAIGSNHRGWFGKLLVIMLLCILFASIDEWIQTFTAGRSGRAMDVLIDSIGALTGIILYNIVCMGFGKLTFLNRKYLIK